MYSISDRPCQGKLKVDKTNTQNFKSFLGQPSMSKGAHLHLKMGWSLLQRLEPYQIFFTSHLNKNETILCCFNLPMMQNLILFVSLFFLFRAHFV